VSVTEPQMIAAVTEISISRRPNARPQHEVFAEMRQLAKERREYEDGIAKLQARRIAIVDEMRKAQEEVERRVGRQEELIRELLHSEAP
jgi:hypothetical protein